MVQVEQVFFVKNYLFDIYDINIYDKNFRDVLCLEFKDKFSHFNFIVCVCYMSPECNRNGRDSQSFFDHLTNLIYRTNDFDFCLYLGDIHARCGNESDLVTLVDNSQISTRSCIDDV